MGMSSMRVGRRSRAQTHTYKHMKPDGPFFEGGGTQRPPVVGSVWCVYRFICKLRATVVY